MPHPLTLTGWADIANVALVILALLALIGAAIQIHLTRSASRRALTYSYTSRLSAPSSCPTTKGQQSWSASTAPPPTQSATRPFRNGAMGKSSPP